MANTIQIKRGLFSSLPTSFLSGEFGWTTDTHQLYVGDGTTKHEVLMKHAYDADTFLYAPLDNAPETKTPAEVLAILSGKAAADFSLNGKKLKYIADPVDAQDAVNLRSMQASQAGLVIKPAVRAATTVNGDLATAFADGQTVDGVALATGDRILIKNQTTASENGIYTVNATGAPTRATDFDEDADVAYGAFTFVEEGTTNADSGWVLSTDGTIVIGTTDLAFVQFSGAGQINAGDGLTKNGNELKVTEDLVWDRDFTDDNSILKADTMGNPVDFVIDTNSVLGRISTGAIRNIAIDTDLTTVSANYDTLAYAKAIKDYVDAQVQSIDTFIELGDTPTGYADGSFLRSTASGTEWKAFDNTAHGTENIFDNAPTSNAFYDHDHATSEVHGAPTGSNLLHSSSLIDCGTF
jgi:hypothetical protein